MKLRLAERFISRDTRGPDDRLTGTTNQAITDIALSINSETRTEALSFDLGGGYRFVDQPRSDGFTGEFTNPNMRLSYTQQAAASAITVTAFASHTDLDNGTTLDVARNPDGTLDSDFADITQDGGTRDRLSFDARLTLRDDAPFGLNFAVKIDDYSYNDLPNNNVLTDYTYGQIRAGTRFDISPVMQANLGLHFSKTRGARDTSFARYGIDAGLILTQPNGQITVDLSLADGDDGGQKHLSGARRYTLENTTTHFGLGISQATTDETFVTGTASLKHTFADESPFGTFTATADRSLTRTNEDLVTSLSMATNYALTPLANMQLSANYAQSENIATGATIDLTRANLSVTYALNPDWTARAGVGIQSRAPSSEAATDSTTLSIGIARSFDLRR